MREPLVTVVCMTYNQVSYIADALDGFVHQETSFPYEVIVHDDCSDDGTADIVAKYAAEYPDLVLPVFEKENQYSKGVPIYKEIVRPLAQGKYIAFCEGDDYWIDARKLQAQFDFMESNPDYSLVLHNAEIVDYTTGLTFLSEADDGDREKTLDELIIEGGGQVNPTASMFFRRSCDRYYREGYGAPVGDHFNLMRLASFGRVEWMSKPMSVYRYGAKGSFTVGMEKADKEHFEKYTKGYIRGLELLRGDLEGRCENVLNERIALQNAEMEKNILTTEFLNAERHSLGNLKGLGARNAARAFAGRFLPAKAYGFVRRYDKMLQKKRNNTLISKSANDPAPLR